MNEEYEKAKMDQVMNKLEEGVKNLFNSENYKIYLSTMAKFHTYSFNNTLLIAMQRPDATLVAGYQAWNRNFGRYVKKGSKGIRIIQPVVKKKEEPQRDDMIPILAPGQTMEDYKKAQAEKKPEYVNAGFKVTSVFDVSDTDGKELPTIGVKELSGNVQDYEKMINALKAVSKVPVEFHDIPGEVKGHYNMAEKKIAVNENMSEVQTIKTLIHEITHSLLDDRDINAAKGIEQKSRNDSECIAESVAFTVCQHFGIDTSDYSFGYIASWSEGKDTEELKASMEEIRTTSSKLIKEINAELGIEEIGKEKHNFVEKHGLMEEHSEKPAKEQISKDHADDTVKHKRDKLKLLSKNLFCR
jgi:hypothetical protein